MLDVLGLAQHDQVKDEINKQNMVSYLLDLTHTLTGNALVLLYEILWSLAFREAIARALRANEPFIEQIQNLAKDNTDGRLKRAVSGLVWQLLEGTAYIRELCCYSPMSLIVYFRVGASGKSNKARPWLTAENSDSQE